MTITLFNFSKKKISTKQPNLSDGTQVTAALKDGCSVMEPEFVLASTNFDTGGYNYLKATLGGKERYYYIEDVIYESSTIRRVRCSEDYRASWKDSFKTTSQYIERCSDATVYVNGTFLRDAYYPDQNGITADLQNTAVTDTFNGFYVLGLAANGISNPITRRGGVSYVIMTPLQMIGFSNTLLTLHISLLSIQTPIQYVYSCVYIPFKLPTTGISTVSQETIDMNDYTMDIDYTYQTEVGAVSNVLGIISKTVSMTSPSHPQLSDLGPMVNYAPFTRIRAICGAFGEFDIPAEFLKTTRTVHFHVSMDITDGSALLEVAVNAKIVSKHRTRLGVPTPLAQITSNLTGLISAGVSAVGSAAALLTGNPVGAAGLISSVVSAGQAAVPRVTTMGTSGSMTELQDNNFYLQSEYFHSVGTDNADIGRPVFKSITINTITAGSYVKCRNARLAIPGYGAEIDRVIDALNEGFIYD